MIHAKFAPMEFQLTVGLERPAEASLSRRFQIGRKTILVISLAVAGALWMTGCGYSQPPRTMRFSSTLPAGDSFGGATWYPSIAVSPDGASIAYVATHNGITQLYLRHADEWDGKPLPGSADAHTPFFSPDGKWVGTVSAGRLVKFPAEGGAAQILSKVPFDVYGVDWSTNGWIYMGTESPLALVKTPNIGGTVLGASALDDDHGETDHRYPEVLPGDKWMLFAGRKAGHSFDEADIQAISLQNAKLKTIIKGGTNPRYIPSGHLVFLRAGVLMAVPFDPSSLQVKGEPVAVVQNVVENSTVGAGEFSYSNGTLAYLEGKQSFGDRELVSVDRNGTVHSLTPKKQPYEDVALSPDGKLLATTIGGPATDIYIRDLARGTDTQFTKGGEHRIPAWSLDGKQIYYSGYTGKEDQQWVIFRKSSDGTGEETQMTVAETPMWPGFVTKDGKNLLFEEASRNGNHSIWALPLDKKARQIHESPWDFDEEWAQLSPDGKWLAYNSNQSGRQEVYVTPYPDRTNAIQISTNGGRHPIWSANGKELFYRVSPQPDAPLPLEHRVKLMAVAVETAPTFKAGTPQMLFDGPFLDAGHDYVVMPDGKSFILIRDSQTGAGPTEMKVILNWNEELKRRVVPK
jgi:eukaryotic-like serine/threonine-protein kinase